MQQIMRLYSDTRDFVLLVKHEDGEYKLFMYGICISYMKKDFKVKQDDNIPSDFSVVFAPHMMNVLEA